MSSIVVARNDGYTAFALIENVDTLSPRKPGESANQSLVGCIAGILGQWKGGNGDVH